MVDAIEGRTPGVAAEDILKIVGKVFKDSRCSTLTLQLLDRFHQQVGKPFSPSTPGGLVTILAAMRPAISSTRQPSRAEVLEQSHKVAALLEQYEAGGQVCVLLVLTHVRASGSLKLRTVSPLGCSSRSTAFAWMVIVGVAAVAGRVDPCGAESAPEKI